MRPGWRCCSNQQAIDSTSPFGKAMMQMACVFGELEREMIRARFRAGLSRVQGAGAKEARDGHLLAKKSRRPFASSLVPVTAW